MSRSWQKNWKNVENHGEPENSDILIIEGFFQLYLMKHLPATFDEIATKHENTSTFIHYSMSINAHENDEHELRSNVDREFLIRSIFVHLCKKNYYDSYLHIFTGADQNRSADFLAELKNVNFKKSVNF